MRHTVKTTAPLYRRWLPALRRLRNALLPVRCLTCGQTVRATHSELALPSCQTCRPLLRLGAQHRCMQCALPLGPRPQAFGWVRCRHCRARPDDAVLSVVCSNYATPADLWLIQMKYSDRPELARLLGAWLALALKNTNHQAWPDVLVPVPMHPDKQRQRGYNQAELLANAVARHTGIDVDTGLLECTHRSAQSQSRKNRQARLAKADNPFRCRRHVSPQLRIGLIDDVVTTQATMQACMDSLRKAGATQFTLLAVCRTPE